MKSMRIVQLSKLAPICKIFKVRSIFSPNLKVLQPTDDELQAHLDFIKLVNKKAMANVFGQFVREINPLINRLSINQINIKKEKKIDGSNVHHYYTQHLAEW